MVKEMRKCPKCGNILKNAGYITKQQSVWYCKTCNYRGV